MRKLLLKIFVFIIFVGLQGFSQEKKLDRAKQQYDKYEYINAQETYLKVAKKGYESADLFKNLGNSFYFNSQFEDALNWYEKLFTTYPDEIEPEYYFRFAQTLKSNERYKEADAYMEKFIEKSADDKRGQLFEDTPNYLERIDFQSGRYEIENSAINSSFTDFGTAFYGNLIVFASSRDTLIFNKNVHQWNDEAFLDLFTAEYDTTNGELSEITKLDNKLNSKFHESTPIFSKDGNTVYFTRNNYDDRRFGRDKKGTNKLKIYRSYKNSQGGWTTPQNLPFNSDEYSNAHPALSLDEKTLYFSSDMPGGKGMSDLYKVAINSDGSFGEPENLGDRINTEGKETFPFISDKNDLYFASNGHMGLGGLDVYVTRLNPQTKEEALIINIGKPVNSPKDDFAFIVNEETKRGYFSSNREGGKGKDDIYSFLRLEERKKLCETVIKGIVKDGDTDEIISNAKVTIMDTDYNIIETIMVGDDGKYETTQKVECNSQYFVRIEKDDFVTTEMLIETGDSSESLDLSDIRKLRLVREVRTVGVGDDLGKVLDLKPIYFDFDDYLIREDAKVELAKVIEVLKQYPEMKINIRSHTDSRASAEYNKKLSQRRAAKTKNYMVIVGGIDSNRLTAEGLGEEELLNNCVYGVECSEEQHQQNRRSEFIIVK